LNGVCLWTVDKNRYTTPRLAMVVLFLPILRTYRLLLFFVTLKTMH
jgi:hypothetical protein